MTDQPVLPSPEELETEVHIPAVLAAPAKRAKKAKPATPVAAPAPADAPTAAASAEPMYEEPTMATTPNEFGSNMTAETTDSLNQGAQAFTADMGARAKDAMAKGQAFFADLNGFTKGNVEALVESGKIAATGMQSMAQDQAAYLRTRFEAATTAARTLATVKSPTEFMKLQGDFAREGFDAMVAETSRSTEAMLKLAGEVVQPISNRVAVAVERFKQAA